MGSFGMQEIAVIVMLGLILAVIGVVPFWLICKKAGLSPFLSLIMLIPFGGLVLPFVLAFIDWPALRRNLDSRID